MGKSGNSKVHKKLMRGSKTITTAPSIGQKLTPFDRVKKRQAEFNVKKRNEFDDQLHALQARARTNGQQTSGRPRKASVVTLQPSILATSQNFKLEENSSSSNIATIRLSDTLLDGETDEPELHGYEPLRKSVPTKSIREIREQALESGHHLNVFEGLEDDDEDEGRYKLSLQPSILGSAVSQQSAVVDDDDNI